MRDIVADMRERPDGNRIVLAHRRADVRELNAAIREARQERGELARGAEAGEVSFLTNDGERKFSEGDRIIFLENNRDLGVKNGMLGDGGRRLGRAAFWRGSTAPRDQTRGARCLSHVADYAAIDHGYATTIHKSQGATVDRAYVLASDRMDRHLSYVAMTRHREEATLYAGRDEFKDLAALSERLSRSGAKETTLDYAERRGIAWRSEIVVPQPQKAERSLSEHPPEPSRARETRAEAPAATKRGMFAGLNLGAGRSRTDAQAFSRVKVATREAGMAPAAEQRGGRDELAQAVDGFARAWSDAARMRTANLPVLEHQKQALGRAGAALEAARPGATRELLSALRHDPATGRAMAGLEGAERAAQLVAGMERERQAQLDPNVRAERTVADLAQARTGTRAAARLRA